MILGGGNKEKNILTDFLLVTLLANREKNDISPDDEQSVS